MQGSCACSTFITLPYASLHCISWRRDRTFVVRPTLASRILTASASKRNVPGRSACEVVRAPLLLTARTLLPTVPWLFGSVLIFW
jgi:hypothetical protein